MECKHRVIEQKARRVQLLILPLPPLPNGPACGIPTCKVKAEVKHKMVRKMQGRERGVVLRLQLVRPGCVHCGDFFR